MLEVGIKAPDFELYDQDGKLHKLSDYIGEEVILRYSLGRNKYEKYPAVIKEVYNNVFVVEIKKYNIVKSFSYSDVLTKTLKIEY